MVLFYQPLIRAVSEQQGPSCRRQTSVRTGLQVEIPGHLSVLRRIPFRRTRSQQNFNQAKLPILILFIRDKNYAEVHGVDSGLNVDCETT